MCCSCDIPHHDYEEVINEFKGYFPVLDSHSLMRESLQENLQHWYLHDLQAELREAILDKIKSKNESFDAKEYLLNEVAKHFPGRVETPYNTY